MVGRAAEQVVIGHERGGQVGFGFECVEVRIAAHSGLALFRRVERWISRNLTGNHRGFRIARFGRAPKCLDDVQSG